VQQSWLFVQPLTTILSMALQMGTSVLGRSPWLREQERKLSLTVEAWDSTWNNRIGITAIRLDDVEDA
jgi:hypothetical protein